MNQVDMAKGVNLNESFYVRIGSYVYQCMMTLDGYKVLKASKVDELYYVPVVDDFTLFKTVRWVDNVLDMDRLARGLVFSTEEEVVDFCNQMLDKIADE